MALLGVFDGVGQHLSHASDGFRTDRGCAFVARPLQDGHASAVLSEQSISWQPQPVEHDVGGAAVVDGAVAGARRGLRSAESRSTRNSESPSEVRAVIRRCVASGAVIADDLATAEHPAVAITLGGGRGVLPAIARSASPRPARRPRCPRRSAPAARAVVAAGALQQPAADDDRVDVGLDHKRMAQRLGDDHEFDWAAADSADVFGQRGAEDAEFVGERHARCRAASRPRSWPRHGSSRGRNGSTGTCRARRAAVPVPCSG